MNVVKETIIMNHNINLNSCNPGDICWVRGKLSFSHLAKKVEGEALERDKQRRMTQNLQPIDRPYTTATVSQCTIIPASGNPAQLSLFEQFIQERFYQSPKHPENGWSFAGYNKGKFLPLVGVMQPDGKTVDQISLSAELAAGLDVTLVLKVFKTNRNNGCSLEGVILNEQPKYFEGAGFEAALGSRGIIFNASPEAAAADNGVDEPYQAAPQPQAPMNAAMGAPAPTATPFSTPAQPAYQTPVGQQYGYQQQAQPAPAVAPYQPAGQAANAGGMIPPTPQAVPSESTGGVHYNPQDRGY